MILNVLLDFQISFIELNAPQTVSELGQMVQNELSTNVSPNQHYNNTYNDIVISYVLSFFSPCRAT